MPMVVPIRWHADREEHSRSPRREESNLRTNSRPHGAMPLRMARVRTGSAHPGPLTW